jgi:hypothetical protein
VEEKIIMFSEMIFVTLKNLLISLIIGLYFLKNYKIIKFINGFVVDIL